MFKIDLLKGEGIPAKSRPEGIAVAVITFAVPFIVAAAMFGCYLHNKVIISIKKQKTAQCEAKISELSGAVNLQQSFETRRKDINNYISEIEDSLSLGRHVQWSSILVRLVENLPESVVLTELSVNNDSVKRKVPKKADPEKTVSISIPVRTLRMNVSGSSSFNCDEAIKDFRDRLYSSALLGPKLDDIRVSQKMNTIDEKQVVSYEIDCVFKPGL